jgi:hypothetical protein
MEDDDGGLFNIQLSSGDEAGNESEKLPRDFQSEEDFKRQRAEWRPVAEVGEVRKLPLFHIPYWFWLVEAKTRYNSCGRS